MNNVSSGKTRAPIPGGGLSLEHYFRILIHRWWIVAATFIGVTVGTAVIVALLPDIYTSETVILVDPQKIPENYIKPTVTGDVRSRLGTLQQQILSATRLQKIIDTLKLYPEERKQMAREEVIAKMRKDIVVSLVGTPGTATDLQAFKISYSGRDPRMVARVANELADLFIDENLKVREQQATGTTEFLENQLQATRKDLETQETKLRDFRLKHIGEMPEQQLSTLQILGQTQSQLQLEGEALSRAEQQRNTLLAMMSQSAPVLDVDDGEVKGVEAGQQKNDKPAAPGTPRPPAALSTKEKLVAQLADQLNHGHTEAHPDVKKLRQLISEEEAKESSAKALAPEPAVIKPAPAATTTAASNEPPVPSPPAAARHLAPATGNPVLESQLKALDAEVEQHRQQQRRLSQQLETYRSKLESIPVREQEIAGLVRDYEISKGHYSSLLDKQLSAETATELEIRQKGEKFVALDTAQPAEKPAKPNRPLLDAAGAGGGLALGILLALISEFFGASITTPEQILASSGIPVLEVIPVIHTYADRKRMKKRLILATVSGLAVTLITGAVLFVRYRA